MSALHRAALSLGALGLLHAAPTQAQQRESTAAFTSQFALDPQHTGRSALRGPHATPAVRWRFRARHRVFASPALDSAGRLLVASIDGGLHALDTSGIERWARLDEHALFGTPAVLGELVIAGRDGGRYEALDARGAVRWTLPTTDNADASPTVGPDGMLYLAHRGLSAVDAQGHVRWSAAMRGHLFGAAALSHDGGLVYAADVTGELLVLRASDGHVERRSTLPAGTFGAPLVLADGALVLGGRDGHVRCIAPDGAQRWDFTTRDEVHGTAALTPDGTVVIGSDDGGIYGVRAADGVQQWRVNTVSRVRASARIDAQGWIFVGSEDDTLYALEPSGRVAWSLLLGADIDSSALILPGNQLAVGCDDGGVYLVGEG